MPTSPATGTPAATPAAQAQPATTRRPRVARTTPPVRLAYTRHATAGDGDDRIVNPAWYRFLLIMLGVGGVAALLWIIYGGFQWGRATTSRMPISTPVVTVPSTPTPAPQVIQPVVVQPVVIQPPAPSPEQVPTPTISDAERRNEALKERLRSRYQIP